MSLNFISKLSDNNKNERDNQTQILQNFAEIEYNKNHLII